MLLSSEADVRASLHNPVREGDTLCDAQLSKLQNASTDFFKTIPIGALSPELAGHVDRGHAGTGVDFALSARHESRGDSRIGAGVRICF